MGGLASESTRDEEARIRAAYAKRQGRFRYSWFNPGHLFIAQERERQLLGLLRRRGIMSLDTKKVLEIGCGTGYWLREFIKWRARPENVTGIDLLTDRVSEAKQLSPEAVRIECGSAVNLTFPDATFDLVLQATVFTSILDAQMKQRIASE